MSFPMRFVRLKRLQRSITGYAGVTVPLRAAMSTVKIPRKLYESALQAWSQVVENASDQWRRILSRDQVSKLEPRLGVQLNDANQENVRGNSGKGQTVLGPLLDDAISEETIGHDVIKDDVLERALKEDRAQATKNNVEKVDQSASENSEVDVEERTKGTTSVPVSTAISDSATTTKEAKRNIPVELLLRTQDDIDARSRHLIRAIQLADLPSVMTQRLEEFSEHLLRYPNSRATVINDKALSVLLEVKMKTRDEPVRALTRQCLSVLGYAEPPRGPGIRILSIDGGGVRGLLVIEVLRQLEKCTGKKISELFDYVVGVSTGAILVGILTALQKDLDECHRLYRNMSSTVFQQSSWWGTGKLVWNHAYYDTMQWQQILQELYGDLTMIHSSRIQDMPRVGILSAIVNKQQLVPFLFRNYQLPPRDESYYAGSCSPHVWEAVRASSSAPFYFEEFHYNGDVHQDGGIIQNNPTAAAIHESRLLWPDEKIQCVVSIGSGRYIPEESPSSCARSTSLKTKIVKIVDSATDTEAVHTLCNDLLPPGTYFRFNPYLSEPFTLDETRPEKMDKLRHDAQMYLRRNGKKFERAAELLVQPRTIFQRCKDYFKDNVQERLV
ncbi:calcium-independent phospholipase A2-gamma-like isoform X1 [Varroa jacobsoni]|uniref:calcium-independent phospholipase A2-gamma-like isoform X1 n=2 Tax=Varroa jacobsoni TaxID=62625 RepID=UPI000BF4306A|nr:calcium-independent phospholipase A2-gamma-like isoform X1 [Varroa jacobsoni]XP_022695115.1 calcium-independent phospholipase A2-gamma-like isoform X1 [Varroa jacobsoni]XP_022695116.1 calcium-independent phospholipase A2-gamma-like isoform X1 [Varroa jacobsoni]